MIPKAKANELIEKMDVIHKFKLNNGKVLPVSMHRSQMVGCAIIAVEEIMLNEKNNHSILDKTYGYWEDVLTELKKMQ